MASTNKTTHYDLSQYIGTDKPTYLTDYNQDMAKIDAGIYSAKAESEINADSIGDLTDLQTSVKTDVVSAVNEVETTATNNSTHIGNINLLQTINKSDVVSAINEVNTNQTSASSHIGDLLDLDTTDKSDLVDAINEVNGKTVTNKNAIGTLSELESTTKTDLVSAVNEVFTFLNLNTFEDATNLSTNIGSINGSNSFVKVARNSDGSLAKIYGRIRNDFNNMAGNYRVSFKTTLRPTSAITINTMVINRTIASAQTYMFVTDLTIGTDGTCTTGEIAIATNCTQGYMWFIPCLLFIKDFGDVPQPE